MKKVIPSKSIIALRIVEELNRVASNDSTDSTDSVKSHVFLKMFDISAPYFEQIISPLISAKIVRSIRGCNGGYMINPDLSPDMDCWTLVELYSENEYQVTKSIVDEWFYSFVTVVSEKLVKDL